MKKTLLLMALSFQFYTVQTAAAQSITLDSCIQWAKQNYPLIKQNSLLAEYSVTNVKTINENWYPKLSFLVKGTYNTEVVKFDFPGITTSFPHDAYVANVSLDQTIFDGGQTRRQKQIEELSAGVEIQKNEIELYKLVDRVSQLYINVLLARENLEVLNIYKSDLDNRHKNLEASMENGLALESNIDELEAESLKTEQSIIESQENLNTLLKTLSVYIGKPLKDGSEFVLMPIGGATTGDAIARPELKLLDLQSELLGTRFSLTNKMALPRVSFFAGANYGRPGPNFINQNLRFFGDAGITLRWNISSLYGLSKEQQRFDLNQRMIDVQREVFMFNLKNSLTTQTGQITSLREIIAKDELIIQKRHSVTTTASAQLENGKITITDYLTQLNAEMQAKLNQKIHEIRLMSAQTTYNTTKGITNF